jgi:uncharacterized protein
VTGYLLDTNALIALAWPNHVHHPDAAGWFRRKGAARFATCPVTQMGFARISSNPAFTAHAVTPGEALALLARITGMPEHDFWPDDLPLAAAFEKQQPVTHRQVTDGYLLALAKAHGGRLATLDRGILSLPGAREITEFLL